MRSAFATDTARSITRSLGRFLAIAAIVALGTGFYAGLRMTAPDMKLSADEFYDGTALMDIRIVSTLGLTDDDIAALRQVEGVDAVMGAYETDVVLAMAGEQYVTRVHSLPSSAVSSDTSDGVHAISDDEDYLNRPILVEGSWPTQEGECVLSADLVVSGFTSLGETVTITDGTQDVDSTLATRTYTVVGYVSSPYYATSSSMGTTTLGSGTVQEYMYVLETDFSSDLPYTEAFVTVEGAAAEHASSQAYDDVVARVMDRIEAMAPEREQLRVDTLKADAQAQLDEKRAEYDSRKADADSQLADAQAQLDEAAATIASSEQELADGQASYESGSAQLASQRASVQEQLTASEQQLADASAYIDEVRPAIEQADTQLSEAQAQWQQGADALAAGWADWQAKSDALESGVQQAEAAIAAIDAQIQALDPAAADYAEQKAALETSRNATSAQLQQLEAQRPALESYRQQLAANQADIDAAKVQLDAQQAAFNEKKAAFDEAVAQAQQGASALASARAQASSQLASAQQQLDDAAAQLASGREQLAQGRADYEDGLAEYERQRAEADKQLADAARQLDDAQHQIDDLEAAQWLVMDRTTNYGVASFEADANRVDSIAAVFPFIFFLVAALVALTTMTRMVEEERVLIGTFKALGYSRARIASKYLAYAAVASGAGSILGVVVLSQVLPAVIVQAYAIIYFVPALSLPLPIDAGLAALAIGLGMGVTLIATWAAATATLRERPATLMLPRAPKAGKRILVERITPLWRRLSFSWKVTLRNLFRYKKRLGMTVIGIAGCTALLLTGLGLSDAINDIIDKQFGQITRYNATITYDEDANSDARDAANTVLADGELVQDSTPIMRGRMLVSGPDDSDLRVDLIVPEDTGRFGDFVDLRERVGQAKVALSDDSLLLTEKLARELGVGVGDTVTLTEEDAIGNPTSTSYTATVSGIVENYIYHYAFMGPDLYEQLTGKSPEFSSAFAITTTDSDLRSRLTAELDATGAVKTVAYNDETIDAYHDMLSSVNMIVVVLVVAAAALAFIVLYNLTNINITERMREIATLKVLGFTPREMNAYIFRETFLLAAIGCAVGLVLGVWMESFVVVTAEVNQVMFGREIHIPSFLIAFALTMVFTAVVMIVMRPKLHRIDMVESLKSNE